MKTEQWDEGDSTTLLITYDYSGRKVILTHDAHGLFIQVEDPNSIPLESCTGLFPEEVEELRKLLMGETSGTR